jgi:hypothetical protein
LGNVAKLGNLTFAWIIYDVLHRNGAKAHKYFTLCVILVCYAVFGVFKKIGTADVGIPSGFRTMEHSKVRFLAGLRKPLFYAPLNENRKVYRYQPFRLLYKHETLHGK